MEWCRDWLCRYDWGVRPGDGLRQDVQRMQRAVRGASMMNLALMAKSSMRTPLAETTRLGHLGLRACRLLRDYE
jgi:formylglycine-generating enzyme required for sulfatase activity